MTLIYDACLLGGIAIVAVVWAVTAYATRYLNRHLHRALADPRFKQPVHCTVIPNQESRP